MTRTSSLLVVDDNDNNRDVLARRLRLKGYDVTMAAGGDEALSLIGEQPFDLVLLDVEMPGLSGLDVLASVRSTHSPVQLPVIMVTARSAGADMVEAFTLGANDYLTKPVDFPVALARITTHLSHKQAVSDLHESEERYALALSGANDGIWDWNLVTNAVHWSPRWKAMLGYEGEEIGSSPDEWFSRIHHDDRERVRAALDGHLSQGNGFYEAEHRILHRNGTFRWVLCRGAAVRSAEGVATRMAGSLTDVTDARVSDGLTGLPNGLLFADLIDRAINRVVRRPEYTFAVLVLSLDRFQIVGDSLGPLTADRLLVAVARRLHNSLRSTDALASAAAAEPHLTLARLGHDEFTVLVDDIADVSDALRVGERLRRVLEKPFDLDGQEIFISAAVGIAVSATGYRAADEILRDARTALHRAQGDSATRCELFDTAMRDRAVARLRLETELRRGLEEDAFVVYYQPIISLESGRIEGFEALLRWEHPVRGLLLPAAFMGVAEDAGLMGPIGRCVLVESCRQMAIWRHQFGDVAPSTVAVNVTSRQVMDANLAADVEKILLEAGLPASSLKLEVTEHAFIDDVRSAQRTLESLRSLGVHWSLDDFGTGYSSLSCLHQLQVNTVKIDRSFVSRLGVDANGSEMVRAIVGLAHSLAMDVVAEGVEDESQSALLRRFGCEFAQGFSFSKAVSAERATGLIARQPWMGSQGSLGAQGAQRSLGSQGAQGAPGARFAELEKVV